jgi:hypothetical protein
MKKVFALILVVALLTITVSPALAGGFDEYGYNDVAGIFNGSADGVDRVIDQAVWGDPTYANDHLVMKWNAEWIRGKAENWSNPPYAAWENNEWNGAFPGGSGETWHYKIVWVGNYAVDPSLIPAGGYGVWGQFAVIMDQGVDRDAGSLHLWIAHANPTGYGVFGN